MCKALLSHYPNEFKNSSRLCSYCWWWSNATNLIESPLNDTNQLLPLHDYSGIPISFWPNLNRIPKNLIFKAVLVVLGRIPNNNAMPHDDFTRFCCPNHGLGAGCHLSLRHLDLSKLIRAGPPTNQGTKGGRG